MSVLQRFLLALALLSSVSYGQEVVRLNDSNFEHDTQASTGSTTGNWLLTFCPTLHCSTYPHLSSLLLELSVEDEILTSGIIPSTLSPENSINTFLRFKIDTSLSHPVLIYLHRGGLYTFRGDFRKDNELREWLLGKFKNWNPKPIPEEHKGGLLFGYKDIPDLLNDFNRIQSQHGLLINCICLGSGLFFMILLAMLIGKITEDGSTGTKKND
ncbi:hypothetical protein TrLO_g13036 [Triparma laevis f. longispina]|uniref:Thioredoxin domain-containing protein n=1 Tax=Triparma laevis f. longispina TaxID=1714387 RepID=A0A9W6ZG55_9STRA|nr:hypothetical protein TrLO_g13036 [Triparma laevis f. longispina]